MKKTIGKTILISICIAVILFLLLPFLETTPPQRPAAGAPQATPQIFTSNPLTTLVNRIARLFGKRQLTKQTPPQVLTARQVNEQFGLPQTESLYADARAVTPPSEQTEAALSSRQAGGYLSSSYQEEDGDWVLIRQEAPAAGSPGMHEVNLKDNAFDSYMRLERAARFTPTAQAPKKKEVPDSKFARFFNPIKRFFGFGRSEEQVLSSDIWPAQEASVLTSFEGIGKSRRTDGVSFPTGTAVDLPALSDGSAAEGFSSANTPSALSYLSPEKTLQQIADFLADSKYPNPQSDKEQQEKNSYRNQRYGQALQYFNQRVEERLNRLAAGQEPQDELKNLLEGACANTAPRAVKLTVCGRPGPMPATPSQLENAKQQNAALFKQKTNLYMPQTGLMPIIGKATQLPPPLDTGDSPEGAGYAKTMEIYDFMFNNSDCQETSCYWVANSIQTNPDLTDSITGAGATLRGDPLGKYAEIQQKFIEYKQEQGAQDPQAAQQQTKEFAPAYILYTLDDLKALQAQNREALLKNDAKAGIALYALSAPIAKQLADDLQSPTFFYGRDDAFIDADTYPAFEDRSTVLTNDLADQIQFFQQIGKELKQNASREVIEEKIRTRAEEITKKAQQERAAFDKANTLGHTERGQ